MSLASEWILPYVVNTLWQVPLLYTFGLLAARMVRPLGVGAEHRIWVVTCILQCFIPACTLIHIGWFDWVRHAASQEAGVSVAVGAASVVGSVHMSARVLGALATVYAVALSYFVARFLWRTMRLSSLRRRAQTTVLRHDTAAYLDLCLQRFQLNSVFVSESDDILSPVSFGLLRKLILLPSAMTGTFTNTDLRIIFAHECAHIYRKDFAKNFLYELLSLPVSYQPFSWATRKRIMETREMICDELAADITGRNVYAGSLLHLAALLLQRTSPSTAPAIGIFDASIFERRIMSLTRKTQPVQDWKRRTISTACVGLCLFTCGSAIALRIHVDSAPASVNQSKVSNNEPVKIASGVMAGNKLAGVNPIYPEAAKRNKIQGTVVLSVVITKEGHIGQLTIKSGPKELGPPSTEAVRQWTYKPFRLNGEPVAVQTTVNVTYSLAK